MGELRRVPTHLRVMMNLACSPRVVADGEVKDACKLRVLHMLLLNVTKPYERAM
jgi:hypothetical protein